MPTFTFTSPEGKSYDIAGPEGSTREQAFQQLQSHLKSAKPETKVESPKQESKPQVDTSAHKERGFFEGDENHEFDWKSVAESTAIGAGIGTVIGPEGTLGGAGLGFISGVAGETARTMGYSDATAMGAEIASGGIASTIKKSASILSKWAMGFHGRAAGKEALELTEEFGAPSVRVDKISQGVKNKVLGEKPKDLPISNTAKSDEIMAMQRQAVQNSGIPIKAGEKPTDAFRNNIYDNMTKLTQQGKPFYLSPEGGILREDLGALEARNIISKADINTVGKIIKNQTSKNPNVAAKANEDILSFMQSGEIHTPGKDTVTKIKSEDMKALRQRLEQYYTRETGQPHGIEALKQMEKQQFQAKAIDDIPNMLRENFKDVRSEEFRTSIKNISQSGRSGKMMFADALSRHFADKDPEKYMQEFSRLRKTIQDSGVMDAKELDALRVKLDGIPKDITKERWKQFATRLFIGTTAAEISKGSDI